MFECDNGAILIFLVQMSAFCFWYQMYLYSNHTLAPESPGSPLGPGGAYRQNMKTQTVKELLKMNSKLFHLAAML